MATTYPDISGASNMLNMINQYRALNPPPAGHTPLPTTVRRDPSWTDFAGEGVGYGGVPPAVNPQIAQQLMSALFGHVRERPRRLPNGNATMLRDLLMRRFGGTQRPDFRNIIGNTARPRPVFDNPWINRF